MLGVVDDPAEMAAYGPRAVSPSETATRSSGRPSSSAAICAIAVRVPVPMSCIAVTTVARAVRADPHPGVGRRPAAAVPDLAREPDAAPPRALGSGAHLGAAGPVRLRAPVALGQVLGGVGPPVDGVGVRVIAPPQLERVELELGGQLVEQALEPERPLDEPRGAERAFGPVFSLAPVSVGAHVRAGVEHLHRAGRRADEPVPADGHRRTPPSSAVRVPSARAPTLRRWIDALRFPPARFSSRRVSAQRTGRPVRRASSAATYVASPGPFFAPKPPPM